MHTIVRALAALAAAATLATTVPAGASVSAPSVITPGNGMCLHPAGGATAPGTPVTLIKCNLTTKAQQWAIQDSGAGTITMFGNTAAFLTVDTAGQLVLGTSAQAVTWTVGPDAHQITTVTAAGTEFLTWVPGHGRQPTVQAQTGPGQVWYAFQIAGQPNG